MSLTMPSVTMRAIVELLGRGGQEREDDAEGGALAGLALNTDVAAVLLDDAFGDRQAQAGAVGLGSEKQFEQPGQVFCWDAGATVLDGEAKLPLCHQTFLASETGAGSRSE